MPWFTKQRKKKARNTSKVKISAVSTSFKANFGRFWHVLAVSVVNWYNPIWPIRPNSGQISPIRCESKSIWHESSHIGVNPREKKNSDAALTRRQLHRTPCPKSGCIGCEHNTLLATSVLSSSTGNSYPVQKSCSYPVQRRK